MQTLLERAIMVLAMIALSGCTANHNSIYRLHELRDPRPTIITVDAKQRSILTTYRLLGRDGTPDAKAARAFCSEPSPDVFSVIAQSLSAGGSFGKSADPASIQAALNLAYSLAEQGSTITRTQTINMLRELMFRTCERYLSGGYDPTELSLQAIRDQRLMVSILAIEQLTGAIALKPVVIGAAGNGGAGVTGDAIVRLDDARKERDKAAAAYDSAVATYEQTNGTDKVCDAIKGKKADELTDAQKQKVKPCNDAAAAKDQTLAERTSKTAAYQELSPLAQSGGVSVATTLSSNANGGFDQARADSVASVSTVVREIVNSNFHDSTEVMMFCLRILRDQSDTKLNVEPSQEAGLKSVCVKYLNAGIQAAEERLNAEIAASQDIRAIGSEANFEAFWTAHRQTEFSNSTTRAQFVVWLKSRLGRDDQAKVDCFATASTENAIKACFVKLPPVAQREAVHH